jgi:hypothetical protein
MYAEIINRVEGTLKTLGIAADEAKTGEGQYTITKDKDTEVMMDVWEQEGRVFFQVMSPVFEMKEESKAETMTELLEENHLLVESAFALINNAVFVKETIECSAFFNQERAISAITRIAFYSESYRTRWSAGS